MRRSAASSSSAGSRRTRAPITRPALLPALALAVALGACGSSSSSTGTSSAGGAGGADTGGSGTAGVAVAGSGSCSDAVAGTLGEVGLRIYREASVGLNAVQSAHRVQRSKALAGAIAADDAGAARTALRALLVNQIAGVQILRGGHVFATAGSGAAIAPVRGTIPGTDASFVLSVQSAHSYLQVARQVTGAHILLIEGGVTGPGASAAASASGSASASGEAGAHVLAGTLGGIDAAKVPSHGRLRAAGRSYQVFSLPARAYPSGSLRIAMLVPSAAVKCPVSTAQARVETLGHVGERIYQEEAHSSYVLDTLRHIEADTAFQRAVAARDIPATRAAIVSFFAAHIHVVRVRVNVPGANRAQRLLYDLGGPYVLAPVHGTLRSGGHIVGRFSMAIQDDAGYLRLARLFTGAEVLMRTGSEQVQGTLDPGPASVPDRGKVSYRGRSYEAYSFTGEAFPAGPLRISLLLAR